jgi:hypothetical protein
MSIVVFLPNHVEGREATTLMSLYFYLTIGHGIDLTHCLVWTSFPLNGQDLGLVNIYASNDSNERVGM